VKDETGLTEHHLDEHVKRCFADEDLAATRSQALDILRAVAILLVMARHIELYPGQTIMSPLTDVLHTGG